MHRSRLTGLRRREVLFGLATLLGAGSPPAFGAAQMQTVVDQTGRTVTIPTHPQRVVSLFDVFITLPLYELGVPMVGSTRIGGRDVYALTDLYGKTADEAGLANVGSTGLSIDLERIASLAPDVIIADDSNLREVEQLARIAP
ncbi:MAG: ABC transporter substrate-binding protein, partial [Pseudomonadota bacterium]